MIIKKENQIELAFGTGDICIAGACFKDNPSNGVVMFSNQSPREINAVGDVIGGQEYDTNEFPVIMTFTKKESIDVLIAQLEQAKSEMISS